MFFVFNIFMQKVNRILSLAVAMVVATIANGNAIIRNM